VTDILFTHSYFLHFDPKELRAGMPYPPLGTITAAAFLRNQGFSVGLHDVMLAGRESEIIPVLDSLNPRLVVIYDDSFNYLTKMCLSRMRQAALELARHAKERNCIVAVFSSDAADHVEEYLASNVDYVLCGEGEETLAELCGMLLRSSGSRPAEIKGIGFRDAAGAIVRTSKRPPIRNLDAIPFPAWDLVDIERYRAVWKSRHGLFSVNISTTRGCPFHCNWCAKPLYGQVYNSRSPENVAAEMKFLKNTIRPDHLWITDDIFGLKPDWLAHFAEVVRREDAVIPFKCLSRVDLLVHDETIRHLKDSGCQTVWVGAESGSQKILDAMEKGTTVEEIGLATRMLRDAGIRVGFFLQFGYPGESGEDIAKTVAMVKQHEPDEIGISVSYPLPGTKFYERVKARLGSKQNWETSDDFDPMIQANFSREFYQALHVVVHKRFRIWRGLRALRNLTARPASVNRRSLQMLASMMVHSITLPGHLRTLKQLGRLPYGNA
jgi:anaerobic magnesium-protoporphyrin IX monomethyl ester cyclase